MERDAIDYAIPAANCNFNSHAHVERDWLKALHDSPDDNFNSHAHVERDGFADHRQVYLYISTHTLTWSVTVQDMATQVTADISTHTLTWSVTLGYESFKNYLEFQLTRSRGA